MKKYIALFTITLVCMFFAVTNFKNPGKDVMSTIEFTSSKMGSIYEDISMDGKLNIVKDKINSSASGTVKYLNAKKGDNVKKGDVLCYIEKRDDKSQKDKTAAVVANNFEISDIIPKEIIDKIDPEDFNKENINLENPLEIINIMQKYKDIFKNINFEALKSLLNNTSKTASAKADSSENGDTAKNGESVPIESNDYTSENNKLIEIYAPCDGKITEIYIKETDSCMENAAIFEICHKFDGRVNAEIHCADVVKIKKGDEAYISLPDGDDINAVVTNISTIAKKVNNEEYFDVELHVTDIDKINYYTENVKINIKSKIKDNTVIVPSSSVIIENDNKNYIYMLERDKLYKKYIEIDEDNNESVSISKGLYANQKIIKNPLELEKNLNNVLDK